MDTIRDNPYPAILIGLGVAWGLANASFSRRDRDWRSSDTGWGGGFDQDPRYTYGGSRYRESSMFENAEHRAKEYMGTAKEYAGDTAQAIRRTGRQTQNQLQRMLNENPLLVGAGALMLGAAFGLAVPESDRENEWMGETRDALVDRAQQAAGDAAAKVQQTARDVADAAGDLADSVTQKPAQG